MLASHLNNTDLVNTLLSANADILKEDSSGCTALTYAISYAFHKNLQPPHLLIDKLMSILLAHGVTYKKFLKLLHSFKLLSFRNKLITILNCPVKQNKIGQTLSDVKHFLIPYT